MTTMNMTTSVAKGDIYDMINVDTIKKFAFLLYKIWRMEVKVIYKQYMLESGNFHQSKFLNIIHFSGDKLVKCIIFYEAF
jgi:hypothetical protein